jgi:hypothetical protein
MVAVHIAEPEVRPLKIRGLNTLSTPSYLPTDFDAYQIPNDSDAGPHVKTGFSPA